MHAWPVARSIFDAPLGERSERADNKLDKLITYCLTLLDPHYILSESWPGRPEDARGVQSLHNPVCLALHCLVPPGSTCLQQEPGESQGGLTRDGRVFYRAGQMRAKRLLYNTM